MKIVPIVAAVLMASCSVGAVYATEPVKPAQKEAQVEKELGKLSTDGATAFRDVRMARIAIFNAEPGIAKSLIEKAQASLKAAKSDDTVYLKAEAELMSPPQSAGSTQAKTAPTADSKPINWLPIDGQLVLGEDLVSTPKKKEAVKKANQHLQAGDRKSALTALKAAEIDINFTMAVAPLDQTISTVDEAAGLIKDGKYYEANALLKQTEDSIRFDTIDMSAS